MNHPGFNRYQYFPQTFAEGRDWFRRAAESAGGTCERATLSHALGPAGEELSTDLAWFGPAAAPRVFVAVSGTHGQEYFCGAATQIQWIASGGPAQLPRNVAVCLIHAHNPYGAAHISRANENFVDLNRNYMDFAEPIRPNPLYAEFFQIMSPRAMDEHVLDDVMEAFYALWARLDLKDAMTAMGGGQTTHSNGLLFCGHGQEWSTKNLKTIVRTKLDHAEKIALIDWHTGLGKFGEPTVMAEHAPDTRQAALARDWWGGYAGVLELQPGARPHYVGTVVDGVAADLRARGAAVVESVVEFGTFENKGILAALLIDRWLRFECDDPFGPKAVTLRTKMAERLNPSLPEWRALVLAHARDIYARTINGLAAWTGDDL